MKWESELRARAITAELAREVPRARLSDPVRIELTEAGRALLPPLQAPKLKRGGG